MTYVFRPGIREEVNLIIGLISASGGGKTFSAMRLASGMVGKGNKFAVIDTEARRSLHYADMFNFDMAELKPPFRPSAYAEAIKSADEAGYKVIVVDSISHEWAGESGILDWQEEELTRMAGDDYRKRESCKMASWIKPKMGHKQMIQKLLQIKANIILCFRAEEKVGMEKENGKTVIVAKGWQPICEKNLPYELTVSFLLTPDKPGYPQPIKLQEQHKAIFPLNKPINEESGLKVSEWARGGIVSSPPLKEPQTKSERQATSENYPATDKQKKMIWAKMGEITHDKEEWKKMAISAGCPDGSKSWMKGDIDKLVKYLDKRKTMGESVEDDLVPPELQPSFDVGEAKDRVLDLLRGFAPDTAGVDAMCAEAINKTPSMEWDMADIGRMDAYIKLQEEVKKAKEGM